MSKKYICLRKKKWQQIGDMDYGSNPTNMEIVTFYQEREWGDIDCLEFLEYQNIYVAAFFEPLHDYLNRTFTRDLIKLINNG